MRMSVPAYLSLGIATILVLITYAVHPDSGFLITVLPMLLVLAVIPLLLNEMNRRQAASVHMREFKFYQIKDLPELNTGAPVRLCGIVESASFKWLNRPHFKINDGSGMVGVFMFAAPRENIMPGDCVETAGSLRAFGLSKERKLCGVRMDKIDKERLNYPAIGSTVIVPRDNPKVN
ncbi:MAG: hypothetical protein A4E53_01829 [Pelotomaculum sp. PtaB.Bin104]|nr:MAG: hypothetical protein A4E53_01829 [Pelotomaculum sp. PtaB.Bin104]